MFRTTTTACAVLATFAAAATAQTPRGADDAGRDILTTAMEAAAGLDATGHGEAGRIAAAPAETGSAEAGLAEAALEAALAEASEADRAAVLSFYADRGHAPFWLSGAGANAEALAEAMAAADRHGLPPARYGAGDLERLMGASDPAQAEVAFTLAYLRYARDMQAGLLEPGAVDDEINLAPRRPEADEVLAALAAEPLPAALEALEPSAPDYRALLAERERLEEVVRDGGWGAEVPAGPALRRGDSGDDVAALRERLAARGYPSEAADRDEAGTRPLAPDAERRAGAPTIVDPRDGDGDGAAAERFDAALEEALKSFQRAHDLADDGIFGAETRAALNAAPEERIGQILVNLERLRWQPEDLGARHVWVNIPAYTVSVFEGGDRVYHTRSVVGEPDETRTPEFSDRMTYLVVNPTWYIPDSIAKRVYLPQLRQDPTVLARNNMRLFTRSGTEIDPGLVDFAALGDQFPFRVRQNPSPSNALGRVKFMFPNQFAIYLHDTPHRELFGRDARAFSNGCIRLEDPFELAHYLLAPQIDDPETQFDTWLAAGDERYVTLDEPIDVHIVYRTVWSDADGVHFRRDVYGRDRKVLDALAEQGVSMPVRETASAPVSPAG